MEYHSKDHCGACGSSSEVSEIVGIGNGLYRCADKDFCNAIQITKKNGVDIKTSHTCKLCGNIMSVETFTDEYGHCSSDCEVVNIFECTKCGNRWWKKEKADE